MTLYLVRHGSAGRRDGSNALDSERELDKKGTAQAERLAADLGGRSISKVLSSPYPRCIQTVTPLAEKLGLDVEPADALAEGAAPDTAWDLVEQHCTSSVVMCSHGDVIPELIRAAERRGMTLPEVVGFAKASVWELLDWQDQTFSYAEYRKTRL